MGHIRLWIHRLVMEYYCYVIFHWLIKKNKEYCQTYPYEKDLSIAAIK